MYNERRYFLYNICQPPRSAISPRCPMNDGSDQVTLTSNLSKLSLLASMKRIMTAISFTAFNIWTLTDRWTCLKETWIKHSRCAFFYLLCNEWRYFLCNIHKQPLNTISPRCQLVQVESTSTINLSWLRHLASMRRIMNTINFTAFTAWAPICPPIHQKSGPVINFNSFPPNKQTSESCSLRMLDLLIRSLMILVTKSRNLARLQPKSCFSFLLFAFLFVGTQGLPRLLF